MRVGRRAISVFHNNGGARREHRVQDAHAQSITPEGRPRVGVESVGHCPIGDSRGHGPFEGFGIERAGSVGGELNRAVALGVFGSSDGEESIGPVTVLEDRIDAPERFVTLPTNVAQIGPVDGDGDVADSNGLRWWHSMLPTRYGSPVSRDW